MQLIAIYVHFSFYLVDCSCIYIIYICAPSVLRLFVDTFGNPFIVLRRVLRRFSGCQQF